MKGVAKDGTGLPADFGWAPLVPELVVSDLGASLAFWCDVIGFGVAYDRPEDKFAYLDREGAHLMLEQRSDEERQWITAALERPFGRGVNFQVAVADCGEIRARMAAAGIAPYMEIEDKWYRAGGIEVGVRQFIAQDPDGYLVRLSSSVGQRPYTGNP